MTYYFATLTYKGPKWTFYSNHTSEWCKSWDEDTMLEALDHAGRVGWSVVASAQVGSFLQFILQRPARPVHDDSG